MSNEQAVKKELETKRKNIESFYDLVDFLNDVKENYGYGYGEMARAIAQAGLATMNYFALEFGITGFQASCLIWDVIKDWSFSDNKCGLRIINYDDMLYPQYKYYFEKIIPESTFKRIQNEALQNIAVMGINRDKAKNDNLYSHWFSIADGNPPFEYKIRNN